jgi:hypothetical protein
VKAKATFPFREKNKSNSERKWYIHEPYIEGKFVKWFNNGAYSNKVRP